jgi:hypothetical protein
LNNKQLLGRPLAVRFVEDKVSFAATASKDAREYRTEEEKKADRVRASAAAQTQSRDQLLAASVRVDKKIEAIRGALVGLKRAAAGDATSGGGGGRGS